MTNIDMAGTFLDTARTSKGNARTINEHDGKRIGAQGHIHLVKKGMGEIEERTASGFGPPERGFASSFFTYFLISSPSFLLRVLFLSVYFFQQGFFPVRARDLFCFYSCPSPSLFSPFVMVQRQGRSNGHSSRPMASGRRWLISWVMWSVVVVPFVMTL